MRSSDSEAVLDQNLPGEPTADQLCHKSWQVHEQIEVNMVCRRYWRCIGPHELSKETECGSRPLCSLGDRDEQVGVALPGLEGCLVTPSLLLLQHTFVAYSVGCNATTHSCPMFCGLHTIVGTSVGCDS